MPASQGDGGRPAYPEGYAAAHGSFALIPAAYVFLVDDDRVLLQMREGTGYYDGWWAASAAGHVEFGETVMAGAVREVLEELGVEVDEAALEPITAMHRTAPTGLPVDQRLDVFFVARAMPRWKRKSSWFMRWRSVVVHSRWSSIVRARNARSSSSAFIAAI